MFPGAIHVEVGGRDIEAGAAAALRLLDRPDRPTAVLAQNDMLAAGAIQAARSLGLEVPRDLTITGFDGVDMPGLGRVLTTVRQPLHERGRRAGEVVSALLRGEDVPARTLLPVELVPGESAGSLARDREAAIHDDVLTGHVRRTWSGEKDECSIEI